MRIIHLGTKPDVFLEQLSKAQRDQGVDSITLLLENEQLDFNSDPNIESYFKQEDTTTVLHVHDVRLLRNQELLDALLNKFGKERTVNLVLSLYGKGLLESKAEHQICQKRVSWLAHDVSAIFISDTSYIQSLKTFDCWSLQAFPLLSDSSESKTISASQAHRDVLLLKDQESDVIASTIENTLKERGYKLTVKEFIWNGPNKFDSLKPAILASDIIIDLLTDSACSYPTLFALSQGKTVISEISSSARELWPLLVAAPILDCGKMSIERRLEGLLKEPRSLIDLGKRGKDYIARYHDLASIASTQLDIYRQLEPVSK